MNTCFRNIFRILLITSVAFFNVSLANAQCAGTGAEVTICNKETDSNLQTFNLFDVLTNETAGGTWIADSNFDSEALDETTGLLNLWAINRFGAHTFTYMNPACDSSMASVTVKLGGYPGENNQNPGTNNVCQILKVDDDDGANIIDLFIFIDTVNQMIEPDIDGTWMEDPNNMVLGVLNDEFFSFGNVPIGTYTFTYTTPDIDSCLERSAIIDVEVRKSPNPGTPLNLYLCETDDMSGLTAVNLFSRLSGEDSNGIWTDTSSPITGEISSGTDFEIDVQNIYNNFGAGTYSFSYEVLPNHPICDKQIATFIVCIEKQLVLEGSVNVDCNGVAIVTYDSSLLNNGLYDLSYTVTGTSLGTYTNTEGINFQNGIAQFNLLPSLPLLASETLTIQINDIGAPASCGSTVLCSSSVTVPAADFDMYLDPTITVTSTTGCALDDILITYANAIDAAFLPINGTLSVSYSVNGITFMDVVTFSNGNAVSNVPADRFMEGINQLVFFEANNFVHCGDITRSSSLNLIPAPPNPVFSIVPDDRCDATSLQFGFNSPAGEGITYNPVTFDVYQFGSEPQQFDPRDPSVSLINNTQGDGTDINITNTNDLSTLPDGDYVFVIRSVQNDNKPCRGLSPSEINNYTAQGITIGLTQNNTSHIFDARLNFRIGDPDPVALIKNTFEVCLLTQAVTLRELSIFAGSDVDITITDLAGTVLPDSYEITKDETVIAVFNSAVTGCDLGTEQITITIVNMASVPVLNPNVFCTTATNTVADLDVSAQDIVWYDAEINGVVYNTTDEIDPNKMYWAEITISGGCVSTNRTKAVINFVDKATAPIPLLNEFCSAATTTIIDLMVEVDPAAIITWYTSDSGPAYTSTTLPLDDTNEYWVTQTIAVGCESDRVQVTYTLADIAINPEPTDNTFCNANDVVLTLNDLRYNETSILREGVLLYFSDLAGTITIPSSELLENVTAPIYVQQVAAGACESEIVEINFTLQGIAPKPIVNTEILCFENNPIVQDLIILLENQTGSDITLYADETTDIAVNVNLELVSFSGTLYAGQTITAGCESKERALVNFVLENPIISQSDFIQTHCANTLPTLGDVYVGNDTVLWFDENNNMLLTSETLQDGRSYFAQIEKNTCLSSSLEIVISLINVQDPVAIFSNADFCGIEAYTIMDLLTDESGNLRFTQPLNHTLVWYDSNDVSTRNVLDNATILESGIYYAVYQVETTSAGESFVCESNSLAITVDLTVCPTDVLIIPDAFSPNGDTINDTFELQNIQFVYPDYNIEIYNRYGRVVFKGDTSIGFWNGKSNQAAIGNTVLPTGVYFYVIHFNKFDKKPYQGQVYLKR